MYRLLVETEETLDYTIRTCQNYSIHHAMVVICNQAVIEQLPYLAEHTFGMADSVWYYRGHCLGNGTWLHLNGGIHRYIMANGSYIDFVPQYSMDYAGDLLSDVDIVLYGTDRPESVNLDDLINWLTYHGVGNKPEEKPLYSDNESHWATNELDTYLNSLGR